MAFEAFSSSLAISLLVIGIGATIAGVIDKKREKIMKETNTSKIGTVTSGVVEIQGTVVGDKLMKSPFSNTSCVYYKCTVDEQELFSLKNEWKSKKIVSQSNIFSLNDESGSIFIIPNGAEIDVPLTYEIIIKHNSDISEHVMAFLNEHKIKFKFGITRISESLRLREYKIIPNETLYVLGGVKESKEGRKYITKNKNPNIYYISTKSEKDNLSHINSISPKSLIIGGCLLTLFSGGILLLLLLSQLRFLFR